MCWTQMGIWEKQREDKGLRDFRGPFYFASLAGVTLIQPACYLNQ